MKFRGDANSQTVFSTDPAPQLSPATPPASPATPPAATAKGAARGAPPAGSKAPITARIRLETSGRAGKAVTVIYGLPGPGERFRDLAKELKGACGAGGTLRQEGPEVLIEVQGDHRPRVAERLRKLGFIVKGA